MLASMLCALAAADAPGPPAWQATLQKALVSHQAGDHGRAAEHYKAAMQLHEPLRRSWQVLNNYGLVMQEDDPRAAAEAFRGVIELNPSGADAYFNLGNALADAEEPGEAVAAFMQCVSLSPDDAEAHYNLATQQLVCGGQDHAEAAVMALQTSLELQPGSPKTWLSMGDALAATRRWDEAVAAYRRGNALRPQHAPGWASLGNALEEGGQNAEAEASWRAALALEPKDGGTYQNLGAMLRRSDRMAESKRVYEAAVAASPAAAEAYVGLGKCYAPPAGGLAAARKGTTHDEYLRYLAATYGVALRLQPTNAGTYNQIGEALTMYGLLGGCPEFGGEGAAEMYAHAHALSPSNTCAATHVAFGDRRAAAAAAADAAGGAAAAGEPAGAAAGAAGSVGEAGARAGAEEEEGWEEGAAPPTLAELSVGREELRRGGAEAVHRAVGLWRRYGVVVFPGLLQGAPLRALREHVAAAAAPNATAADYTAVTRDARFRVHKALGVRAARGALDEIAARLGPFFAQALGAAAPPLLESGFMVTSPGAEAQQFHRDVAPAVVSRSSLAVSCQVSIEDTAATQGPLEVVPGTHAYDPRVSDRERLADPRYAQLPVAVPAGSVAVYMLHLMHRGGANTHRRERPFYFFTLAGEGVVPPGLAYTIESDDIGGWQLHEGKVAPRAASL